MRLRKRWVAIGLVTAWVAASEIWGIPSAAERASAGSQSILTARGPVEVREKGQGPVVLTFHGMPGGADLGILITEGVFGEGYRKIVPSRPGYLKTPLMSGRTPAEQADLFADVAARMGVNRVIVFAFSGGGPAALEMGIRYPELCAGLVLGAIVSEAERPTAWDRTVYWVARGSDWGIWWLPPVFPSGEGRQMAGAMSPMRPKIEGWDNDVAQFAALPAMAVEKIEAPVLILQGLEDGYVSPASARRLASRIPGAELYAVAGEGHMGLLGREDVRKKIRQFVETKAR